MKNDNSSKKSYVNERVEGVFGVHGREMLRYVGCLNHYWVFEPKSLTARENYWLRVFVVWIVKFF